MAKPRGAQKPEKPYAEFPLTPHPCGQWCKKIHGKLRYFGPWDDPEGALEEYARQRDRLHGGGDPDDSRGLTLEQLCNLFLASSEAKVELGDLAQVTWNDYKEAAQRLVNFFGPARTVASLAPKDFERYRLDFPKSWGGKTVNNQIVRATAIFNFANREGLTDRPVRLGSVFSRVPQKRLDIERAKNEEKFFEAAEIHKLLDHASLQMKAMILLGVNAGYGPADIGRMTRGQIAGEWLSDPRAKTGIWRSAWLWPETRDALAAVLSAKRTRVPEQYEQLVFLTRYRKPWWVDGEKRAPVCAEFTKVRNKAKAFRMRVGFGSLRHVTQTIGGQAPGADPVSIKIVMGHKDSSISGHYRERFDPSQIKSICQHLRSWWLAGKSNSEKK